jgi:hypothetical protein
MRIMMNLDNVEGFELISLSLFQEEQHLAEYLCLILNRIIAVSKHPSTLITDRIWRLILLFHTCQSISVF